MLHLKPQTGALRPAAAWWLAGAAAADWLAEIRRWNVDLQTVRLAFAGAGTDGVLVLPRGRMPAVKPRGLAFGLESGSLWLPCDAALSPPVTEDELRRLLKVSGGKSLSAEPPGPEFFVWHPAHGLMLFRTEHLRGISTLLRGPALRVQGSGWLAAVPVEPLLTEVRSIRLTASPAVEGGGAARDLFGDAASEIGSETPQGLPPEATGKAPPLWKRILNRPKAGDSTAAGKDAAAGGAGGIGGFFSGISQALEKRRWAALEDLVNELRIDPDKGLRRAIPFGGGLPRGAAPPGAHLPERDGMEFDAGRIGLSGRADVWNIPSAYHEELRVLYHELALREKRLGRWRRAACIYAELLGDLAAAALVLREGGCFRDAALLYRDHLRQPRAAAECLQAGGFHAEAAALFEHERLWEEAGEAWQTAGQTEQAAECFRHAAEGAEGRGDFLRASLIEEEKRGDPAAALAVLRRAWPEAEQAAACLLAEFDLTVRKQWANAALQRLEDLRGMDLTPAQSAVLARLLGPLSRAYPDESVRTAAREGALERLSVLLRGPQLGLVRQAAQWLSEMHPDDTLLAHDASRHAAARAAALTPATGSAGTAAAREAGAVSKLHIRRGDRRGRPLHRVLAAAVSGEDWYLLGRDQTTPGQLLAVHGSFREGSKMTGFAAPVNPVTSREGLPAGFKTACLIAGPGGNILAADPAGLIQGSVALPVRGKGEMPSMLGRPAWLPECWTAVTATPEHWLVLQEDERMPREIAGFTVNRHSPDGALLSQVIVPWELSPEEGASVCLAAHGPWLIFSAGSQVTAWTPERTVHFTLESPVTQLAVSPWWSRPSVVAGCLQGSAVLWPGTGKMFTLTHEGEAPAVGFTTHGHVIAADAKHLVCAVSHSRGLSRVTRIPWHEGLPVAVLRAPVRDGFLIADRNGFLHPCEVQR